VFVFFLFVSDKSMLVMVMIKYMSNIVCYVQESFNVKMIITIETVSIPCGWNGRNCWTVFIN